MSNADTFLAVRTKMALVQNKRDKEIRLDERQVIIADILGYIHDNEEAFSGCSAESLLLILHQIEKSK